jgi:uncharacterized membrane protein YkvI
MVLLLIASIVVPLLWIITIAALAHKSKGVIALMNFSAYVLYILLLLAGKLDFFDKEASEILAGFFISVTWPLALFIYASSLKIPVSEEDLRIDEQEKKRVPWVEEESSPDDAGNI